MSKSSVHRHQQSALRRNQHPESFLWETEAGQAWLARLIFATLYLFGVKNHIGAGQLSEFFHLLRLDTHVGISDNALRTRLQQMENLLPTFQTEQERLSCCPTPQRTVAMDEVFFQEMMLLVMMDLPSGYILLEEPAPDRCFETWHTLASARLDTLKLSVKHAVSDRAKALIKLAMEGFDCYAGADLFHAQYDLSRWFPAALGRTKKKAIKLLAVAQKTLAQHLHKTLSDTTEAQHLQTQVEQAASHVNALEQAHTAYRQHQQAISLAVHPFNPSKHQHNCVKTVTQALHTEVDALEVLAQQQKIPDRDNVLGKFRRQITDLGSHVEVWWLWVNGLLVDTDRPTQQWVTFTLLPVIYWHHQRQHSKKAVQREQYEQAWEQASQHLAKNPPPTKMTDDQYLHWQAWCADKVQHFHRASSAVEGRNGCLAQMYHNGRGLTDKRLTALTVIHNYGIRRDDGSTAASRLFEKPSPDLFEWLLAQMGKPPLPRRRRGKNKSNPLMLLDVPA